MAAVTEDQAAPVAGNGQLTVELVKPFKMFNRCAPFNRSALFFRHFERLKRLEGFEPSVSAPRFTVCMLLPSFSESSGLDSLPRSTLRILKTLHCSCLKIPFLATNVTYLQSH